MSLELAAWTKDEIDAICAKPYGAYVRALTAHYQQYFIDHPELASDHPLTAPSYSEQRSNLAKELGLGRGGRRSRGSGGGSAARGRRGRGRASAGD